MDFSMSTLFIEYYDFLNSYKTVQLLCPVSSSKNLELTTTIRASLPLWSRVLLSGVWISILLGRHSVSHMQHWLYSLREWWPPFITILFMFSIRQNRVPLEGIFTKKYDKMIKFLYVCTSVCAVKRILFKN